MQRDTDCGASVSASLCTRGSRGQPTTPPAAAMTAAPRAPPAADSAGARAIVMARPLGSAAPPGGEKVPDVAMDTAGEALPPPDADECEDEQIEDDSPRDAAAPLADGGLAVGAEAGADNGSSAVETAGLGAEVADGAVRALAVESVPMEVANKQGGAATSPDAAAPLTGVAGGLPLAGFQPPDQVKT